MKKIKLFLTGILILGTGILNADWTFTEHFTDTYHKDASSTTVLWDTGSGGQLRLALNISEVGSFNTGGSYQNADIFIKGGFLYLAHKGDGLKIIDITNPASMSQITYTPSSGYASDVYVQGNYAYVAAGTEFEIVDISSPTAPTRVGYLSGFNAKSVFVWGNRAIVADGSNDRTVLIDISTSTAPLILDQESTAGQSAEEVYVEGKYAYVAAGNDGLYIYEIRDTGGVSNDLYEVSHIDTGKNMFDIHVSSNYAYIGVLNGELLIYDVSNPAGPVYAGEYNKNITGDAITVDDVFVSGNYAYIAGGADGFYVLDVSDKTNPRLNGWYDMMIDNIYIEGSYAYTMNFSRVVKVLEISDISNLVKVGENTAPSASKGLHIQGNYAYSADNGNAQLEIYNISVSESPSLVNTFTESDINDVFVSGRYAYLAVGNAGANCVKVLDVSNLSSIVEKGSVNNLNDPTGIWIDSEGRYAYVADGSSLTIVNVLDVTSPYIVGSATVTTGSARRVVVKSSYAYVACGIGDQALNIFDISIASKPAYVTKTGAFSATNDVYVSGNYAYVAGKLAAGESDLRIYDISNSTNPVFEGTKSDASGSGYNCVFVSGKYAYVGDNNKIRVVNIAFPDAPDWAGDGYSQSCNDIWVSGNHIFGADDKIIALSGQFEYNTSSDTVQSTAIKTSTGLFISAALTPVHTLAASTSIQYFISADSGTQWVSLGLAGGTTDFAINYSSDNLRWKAYLNGVSSATPYISSVTISWTEKFKPDAPTNFIATEITSGSIKWTWDDNSSGPNQEDYFDIKDQNEVTKGSVTTNTTFWVEELSPNTTNTRYVRAYNVVGSSDSSMVTKHTLVDVYDSLTISTDTSVTLELDFSQKNNPDFTKFAIFNSTPDGKYLCSTGTLVASATFYTYAEWNPPFISTGLVSGTEYFYQLIGDNQGGVKSTSTAVSKCTIMYPPKMPTDFTGTVLSTSSIKWTWVDTSTGPYQEDYFYIREFAVEKGSVTANTTYWIETGLTPNTTYIRYARAWSVMGSSDSLEDTECTYAEIPGAPAVSTSTINSLEITIDEKSNPDYTLFAIYNETEGKYLKIDNTLQAGATFYSYTEWDMPTPALNIELSTNTAYTYRTIAKNKYGIVTDSSPPTTKYTLAAVPDRVIMESVSPISITVTATGTITNITAGSSGLNFWFRDNADMEDASTSTWIQTNYYNATQLGSENLESNTKYKFEVQARNGNGVETVWSTTTYMYTSPLTPTLESDSHPSEGQWYSDSSVDITVIQSGNHDHIHYVFDQTEFRTDDYVTVNGVESSSSSITADATADGIWYFHLVAHSPHDSNLDVLSSTSSSNVAKYTAYIDITSPGEVSSLSATPSGTVAAVTLGWTNPSDSDYQGTLIVRSTNPVTFTPSDEASYTVSQEVETVEYIIHITSAIAKTDSGLNEKTTYYYKAWAYDKVPKYSVAGSSKVAKTGDFTAPNDLAVTASDKEGEENQAVVSWTQSDAADFAGYKIYRATSNFTNSGSALDGVVFSTTTQTYTVWDDTSVVDGQTYYYAVAAYDTANNEDATVTTDSVIPADDVNPTIPDSSKLNVNQNDPGTNDTIYGDAGAIETSVNLTVKVYKESTLTNLLGSFSTTTVSGGFGAFSIGDNQGDSNDLVWVVAVDTASNVSDSTSTANNVSSPSDLSTTASDKTNAENTATISWTQSDAVDFAGYRVYRSTNNFTNSGNALYGVIFSTTIQTYIVWDDTSVVDGATYYYAVAAYDTANNEDTTLTTDSVTPADDVNPTIPDSSKLHVNQEDPGANDTIYGDAGTIETGVNLTVKVYKESTLTN
ncbi:MAG: hypothetical protein ABIH68_03070, partial [bacterium]